MVELVLKYRPLFSVVRSHQVSACSALYLLFYSVQNLLFSQKIGFLPGLPALDEVFHDLKCAISIQ